MSDRGDSTRDWLLKKLLKAKESLVEQSQELKAMGKRLEAANTLAQDVEGALVRTQRRCNAEAQDAQLRIQKLSKHGQFTVVFRTPGGDSIPLAITSVSSANGETVISVER